MECKAVWRRNYNLIIQQILSAQILWFFGVDFQNSTQTVKSQRWFFFCMLLNKLRHPLTSSSLKGKCSKSKTNQSYLSPFSDQQMSWTQRREWLPRSTRSKKHEISRLISYYRNIFGVYAVLQVNEELRN